MNQKYNYLQNYLKENIDKTLDSCSVFDVDKFDQEQNVDYVYFFIANSKPVLYEKDLEEALQIKEFKTNDYEDIQTPYPVVTSRPIPVVTLNSHLRNTDKFYAYGILKIPNTYWKENPAVENYAILLQNLIKKSKTFERIKFPADPNKLLEVFTDATDISTANVDLRPTVLINTHKGNVNDVATQFTDITWANLDIEQHDVAMKSLKVEHLPFVFATVEPQNNNMQSGTTIQYIINQKVDGSNVYASGYGRTAHHVYDIYTYDFNTMKWYDWINFINNQYDNGVLVTEYAKNIRSVYNTYKIKYISTWNYPKYMFTQTPYVNVPKVVQEDPTWKTITTAPDKVKYLKDVCKQIKYNWYNKNTLAYVCCHHTYCNLKKLAYPKGLIIHEGGQEVCKNCGEVIGDYNDENAFVDGMDTMDEDTTIKYTWRENQKEEEAMRSWKELSVLVDAVDPSFLNSTPFINRFIQLYHTKDYYQRFEKYSKSPFSQTAKFKEFLTMLRGVTTEIIRSNTNTNAQYIQTRYFTVIGTYINNKHIVEEIKKLTGKDLSDISMKEEDLIRVYRSAKDQEIKTLLLQAIANRQAVAVLVRQCTKYYFYEYQTARRRGGNFRVDVIGNFILNVFRKSHRFYQILMVMYTIAKVKSKVNDEKTFTYDFNNIKWSALFEHSITQGYYISDLQSQTILNLYNFSKKEYPQGIFFVMNLKVNSEEEYYANSFVVQWINTLFEVVKKNDKNPVTVTVTMSERKIQYNNSALQHQQELINKCYQKLGDIPLLNNVNDVITNKVIDAITCPDILTRKFDANMSFKQLVHSKFPTTREYFADKRKNNLIFNSDNKMKQYAHMDIVQWIDTNYIRPLSQTLFNNATPDKSLTDVRPSVTDLLAQIKKLQDKMIVSKSTYEQQIANITIQNECVRTKEFIRNLEKAFLKNINTVEKLLNELTLIYQNRQPTSNYTQQYYTINPINNTRYINTYIILSRLLIEWYMLCLTADNGYTSCKSFNILKNSIDNLHTYIFTKGIPYNILTSPVQTYNTLLEQFINEMFIYNKLSVDLLKVFFDDLRIHTQLFVSPDDYTDTMIRTSRLIQRTMNRQNIAFNILEREDLTDLDEEERGTSITEQILDDVDILSMGTDTVEELDENELIGGELETFAPMNEDMWD